MQHDINRIASFMWLKSYTFINVTASINFQNIQYNLKNLKNLLELIDIGKSQVFLFQYMFEEKKKSEIEKNWHNCKIHWVNNLD